MDSEHLKLSSLRTPQETDIVQVNASKAGHSQRLADAREQKPCLSEEEVSLEQELLHCDAILMPIPRVLDDVPDDILREIFVRTLPTVVTITPSDAPVLLTHVCRRWRQVAVDFIYLWRRLSISCRSSTQAASELLQRSVIGRSVLTSVAPMLTRLCLHRAPFALLIHSLPDLFPLLERLIISPHLGSQIPVECVSIQAFMNAPRLRYVSLYVWDWLILPGKVRISLPWQQLTHFSYMGDGVATYLPLCPNLVYLHFELNDVLPDPDPWDPLPNGECLSRLEGLSIKFAESIYCPVEFFDKYRVPNLESLRFEVVQLEDHAPVWNHLRDIVSECPKLTHLSLRCDELESSSFEIRALLGCVPRIQILDVEIFNDWDGFFHVLEWNDQDAQHQLLPQLHTLIVRPAKKTLRYREYEPVAIPVNSFLSFISTRMARPLEQRIRKIVAYPSNPLDRQSIQQYIDDGLAYGEYPVGSRVWHSDAWMVGDPALYHWPELQSSHLRCED